MSFSPFSVSVSWKIFPLYHRLSEKASAAEREQTDTMKTILLGNFRDRHKHRWIIPPYILRLTVLIIIRQCLMIHWHHLFRQERPSLTAWNPLFCRTNAVYPHCDVGILGSSRKNADGLRNDFRSASSPIRLAVPFKDILYHVGDRTPRSACDSNASRGVSHSERLLFFVPIRRHMIGGLLILNSF